MTTNTAATISWQQLCSSRMQQQQQQQIDSACCNKSSTCDSARNSSNFARKALTNLPAKMQRLRRTLKQHRQVNSTCTVKVAMAPKPENAAVIIFGCCTYSGNSMYCSSIQASARRAQVALHATGPAALVMTAPSIAVVTADAHGCSKCMYIYAKTAGTYWTRSCMRVPIAGCLAYPNTQYYHWCSCRSC